MADRWCDRCHGRAKVLVKWGKWSRLCRGCVSTLRWLGVRAL